MRRYYIIFHFPASRRMGSPLLCREGRGEVECGPKEAIAAAGRSL